MILELPFPPSVNTYYRIVNGHPVLSKGGRNYKKTVGQILYSYTIRYNLPLHGDLQIGVALFPATRRQYDIDNGLKALLDSLEVEAGAENGAYINDNQIVDLHVLKKEVVGKPGKAVVRIVEL